MITQPITYRVEPAEHRALEDRLRELTYVEGGDYEAPITLARVAVREAAPALAAFVRERWADDRRPGPVQIENLPFDATIRRGLAEPERPMPPQPSSLSEGLLLGLVPGEPYAVSQESLGLVSNLCPKRQDLERLTGLGSRRALGLHIENAAARLLPGDRAPDGLALIGRSAEKADAPGTLVADGRLAYRRLEARDQAILRDEARFIARFPLRWRLDDADGPSVPTAVVYGDDEAPSFVAAFYGDILTAADSEAASALERFRVALEAVAIAVVVRPGTALLVDNHRVFHGRAAFEPAFDEDGLPYRWLQRVFWTSSLNRFERWPVTNGRIVHSTV